MSVEQPLGMFYYKSKQRKGIIAGRQHGINRGVFHFLKIEEIT